MTLPIGSEPRVVARPTDRIIATNETALRLLAHEGGRAAPIEAMDPKGPLKGLDGIIRQMVLHAHDAGTVSGKPGALAATPRIDTGTPLEHNPLKPWEALKLRRSAAVQEQIRTTLRSGRIAHSPASSSLESGANGELQTVTLVDRHSGARTKAVLKPISGGGAQELFGFEVARALKIEHLVPAVGRRADGTAAMEFRPGDMFLDAEIGTVNALEKAFRKSHLLRDPTAPEALIARRAHVDRQLVQTFDYLIANGDRHGKNALFDARRGIVSLIDNGLLDRFDPVDGAPRVRMNFQGGMTAVYAHTSGVDAVVTRKLDEEVVAILRRTDRTHLKRAFGQMLRDQAGAPSVGRYARASKPEFLDQLFGRLDDAIKHGVIRVRGI